MREALQDVRDALERNLHAKKGGLQSRCENVWPVAWTADALSHGMSECKSASTTPKPCKPWRVS